MTPEGWNLKIKGTLVQIGGDGTEERPAHTEEFAKDRAAAYSRITGSDWVAAPIGEVEHVKDKRSVK